MLLVKLLPMDGCSSLGLFGSATSSVECRVEDVADRLGLGVVCELQFKVIKFEVKHWQEASCATKFTNYRVFQVL